MPKTPPEIFSKKERKGRHEDDEPTRVCRCFFARFAPFPMLRSPPANRRRSPRNRRNTLQPATAANRRDPIVFTPKLKYSNSFFNEQGVFVITKRKRAKPTEAELEAKKQKKQEIKIKHVPLTELQWKVVNFYQHGVCMENYQFVGGPKSSKTIIRYLQENVPKYSKYNAAKSFFYATLKKFKQRAQSPHLDPFRERRGENKVSPKRKNPAIVEMVDELLSEDNSTAKSVQSSLRTAGHQVSLSTVYRIAKDLFYRWQKPWYTDVLTPAQKLKRKLFCAQHLRLSEEACTP